MTTLGKHSTILAIKPEAPETTSKCGLSQLDNIGSGVGVEVSCFVYVVHGGLPEIL